MPRRPSQDLQEDVQRSSEHSHAPHCQHRHLPKEDRWFSDRNLPGRRNRDRCASTTGRLLILRTGAVAVLREGVEIATVREPGAVFGELSVLLDQPHSADVRALEVSQFYVADAATLLRVDPIALLYVATVLARRLDDANQALIELRRQLEAGRPHSVIEKTAEEIEGLLGASATNMAYARYPYDLFAPGAPSR